MYKKNNTKNMLAAAMIGGMGIAGCLYLKNNKCMMTKIKNQAKNLAKKTYEALDTL